LATQVGYLAAPSAALLSVQPSNSAATMVVLAQPNTTTPALPQRAREIVVESPSRTKTSPTKSTQASTSMAPTTTVAPPTTTSPALTLQPGETATVEPANVIARDVAAKLVRPPKDLERCPGAAEWVRASVAEQLRPWRETGITLEMHHRAANYGPCVGGRDTLEVKGGKVLEVAESAWGFYMTRAIKSWPFEKKELRDFRVVGEMGDWPCTIKGDPRATPNTTGPTFTNANNGHFHSVLMPVKSRPQFRSDFPEKRRKALHLGAHKPWHKRKDVAVWRGTVGCAIGCGERGKAYFPNNYVAECFDTNRNWDPDMVGFTYGCGDDAKDRRGLWMKHYRTALVNYSIAHGKQCGIDARFGAIGTEHEPFFKSYVNDTSPWVGGFMDDEGTAGSKYVFHVGNNGYADRSWRMFALGSVVLLVDNGWREWYFSFLKPFKHYIPVREDAADVCDQLRWAREHPEEAEAIANAGRQFIENCLNVGLVDLYTAEVMRQLGALWLKGRKHQADT